MLIKKIQENYENNLNNHIFSVEEKKEIKKYFSNTQPNIKNKNLIVNDYNLLNLMESGFVNNEIIINDYIKENKYFWLIFVSLNNQKDLQLSLEQIDKILKKEKKDSKNYKNMVLINLMFKTQKNILKSKYILPENTDVLKQCRINKNLEIEDIKKLIELIKTNKNESFDYNKTFYKNILINLKINKEILEIILKEKVIYSEVNFKENVIYHILSNENIDTEIIEYLIKEFNLTIKEINNCLSPKNKNVADFIKQNKNKITIENQHLFLIKNHNDLEKIYKSKKIYFNVLLNYVKKNIDLFDKNKLKEIFKNEKYIILDDNTTDLELNTNFNFSNFKTKESLLEYINKEKDKKEIKNLSKDLNDVVTKCNLSENFILSNLQLLSCVNAIGNTDLIKENISLIFLAKHQFLPNSVFNNSFLEECLEKNYLDVAIKQMRSFDNYKHILFLINNLKITEDETYEKEEYLESKKRIYKTELIFNVLNNNYFLSKINKNEFIEILTEIKNIEYPLKISEGFIEKILITIKKMEKRNLKLNEFKNNNHLSF